MKLIVGLGNPGKKFKKTRHNIGFWILDEFSKKFKFPKFKLSKKFRSLISQKMINKERIFLAKPQTFMNESGKAVKILTKSHKLKTKNLFVIHDDLDLPLGKFKISKGRGSAGHKGVQSIIDELETKDFVRFRIGLSLKQTDRPVYGTKNFVLKRFNKSEKKVIKEVIKRTCQSIEVAIKKGVERAMQKFN